MYDILKGTGVALVTPFTAEGTVDFEGLQRLLQHTDDHITYRVIHGTTGESVTTTPSEKKEIFEFIRSNNPNNLPLVYGLGGNNTQVVLDGLKNTDLEGVTAILSVAPYYNKPTQEGLFRHYTAIADASPLPIILYNVPGRTVANISAETTLRLAEHPNIIGVKEASGNLNQIIEISRHKPDDFLLISGDDLLTVPMMSVGCCGVISVLANAVPEIFTQTINAALEGDFKTASELLFRWKKLNNMMYYEGNPGGVKHLLKIMGVCENTVRLPLAEISEKLQEEIAEEYKNLTAK